MKIFEEETILTKVDIDKPEFEKAPRRLDWRVHVPEELKQQWFDLTERERQIIVVFCLQLTQRDCAELNKF